LFLKPKDGRADPVWRFFMMAALGLPLVARFPVRTARVYHGRGV
jgi:hypothetical protein